MKRFKIKFHEWSETFHILWQPVIDGDWKIMRNFDWQIREFRSKDEAVDFINSFNKGWIK